MNNYDVNGDGLINSSDDVYEEEIELLISECDFNGDGSVDACEMFQCEVNFENIWRDENCPEAGHI